MGDSYRPRLDRDRPHALTERMTFTSGNGDSYRPNNGASAYRFDGGADNYRPYNPAYQKARAGNRPPEFTFESSHAAPQFPPTGPANQGSRTNPRHNPHRDRNLAQYADSHRGRRGNHRGGGFRKPAPHERALLRQRDDGLPERTMGVSDGPSRFLNPEDLSDDSEQDMDVESDDSDAPARGHNKKKSGNTYRADGDSVPQWSNPDPYTVLPPPDETTGKKTDFVKLIRKAKNQEAEQAAVHGAVAANDDFISFDDEETDAPDHAPQIDASLLAAHHDNARDNAQRVLRRSAQETIEISDDDDEYEPPPFRGALSDLGPIRSRDDSRRRAAEPNVPAQRPPQSLKRRRAYDGPAILAEWRPTPGQNATPWLPTSTHQHPYAHLIRDPTKWLHNEILDFQDLVMPRPRDQQIRNDLVDRLDAFMDHHGFIRQPGRILCFGSFPAGLYLPTADMDLVYASEAHFRGGPPQKALSVKSLLFKIANKLYQTRMSTTHPTVITKAKVPIIKFVDDITKLEVDISFENLGGLQAQATFHEYKDKYANLPCLVSLVKQFLSMRGANEVHSGGIGGFSIICLIVSYLQHSPETKNLGDCFLGFLKYYGHDFNLATTRIQMNPPAILKKDNVGIDGREEKIDGLSIQDPNNTVNNITGGSHKAKDVFMAFAAAYDTLQDRMTATANGQDIGNSILGYVLGGNYQSYFDHFAIMDDLYRR